MDELPSWVQTILTFIGGALTIWIGLVKNGKQYVTEQVNAAEARVEAKINGQGERITENRSKIDKMDGQLTGMHQDIMIAINTSGQALQNAVHELDIKLARLEERLKIDDIVDKAISRKERQNDKS